jgi:hypothetical protein
LTSITQDTDYQVIDAGVGGMGIKTLLIRCINTVDATNTLTVTLANYGIAPTGFIGILSWVHTTDNSVSALETNTTSVSSGVLTITIGAGTDNDSRFILVFGLSNKPAAAASL